MSVVYDPDEWMAYMDFVRKRHEVWEARQRGDERPWTDDPIIAARKFTNVYRFLDWGSQFVIKELLDPADDPADVVMRLFLYRHTGRIEMWEHVRKSLGEYPTLDNISDVKQVMLDYRAGGKRSAFTGAYIVRPPTYDIGANKLEQILDLTINMFVLNGAADEFLEAPDQHGKFMALSQYHSVGDFMSMQVLTDWGYSPHCGADREDEFVVAGPGAQRGARSLTRDRPPLEVIHDCHRALRDAGETVLSLPNGTVRPPSLMDTQNTLCEWSKYVRFRERGGSEDARPYATIHSGREPILAPAHWN